MQQWDPAISIPLFVYDDSLKTVDNRNDDAFCSARDISARQNCMTETVKCERIYREMDTLNK